MTLSYNRPFAVVTGASSGIGLELARQFATNGFDLLIAAEDDAVQSVAASLGPDVRAVQADLATSEGVDTLWDAIEQTGRPLSAIAINAGVGVGGAFADTDLDAELNMIDLNVRFAVKLSKMVVQTMTAQGEGKILFTSSIAGTMPSPFEAVYGATKAFLLSFSEALRNELKDTGISVTALMPGPTDTNFFHRAGLDDTKVGQSKKDDPADVAKIGFDAMMSGKDAVFGSSAKTKMTGLMNELLPETLKAEQHRKMSEPGSGQKKAS